MPAPMVHRLLFAAPGVACLLGFMPLRDMGFVSVVVRGIFERGKSPGATAPHDSAEAEPLREPVFA